VSIIDHTTGVMLHNHYIADSTLSPYYADFMWTHSRFTSDNNLVVIMTGPYGAYGSVIQFDPFFSNSNISPS
jgi:hypothetical protein